MPLSGSSKGETGFAVFDNLRDDSYTFPDDSGAAPPYNYFAILKRSTFLVRRERNEPRQS